MAITAYRIAPHDARTGFNPIGPALTSTAGGFYTDTTYAPADRALAATDWAVGETVYIEIAHTTLPALYVDQNPPGEFYNLTSGTGDVYAEHTGWLETTTPSTIMVFRIDDVTSTGLTPFPARLATDTVTIQEVRFTSTPTPLHITEGGFIQAIYVDGSSDIPKSTLRDVTVIYDVTGAAAASEVTEQLRVGIPIPAGTATTSRVSNDTPEEFIILINS